MAPTPTWSYRNVGDYNQDGIVNIMDITPLAAHFNESADEGNEWIDGNGDGAITILDVTPLAANFFCDVAGYEIEGATVGGDFSAFETVDFAVGAIHESRPPTAGKPLQFEYAFSAADAGALARFRVVPVDDAGEQGTASNEAEPPTAPPRRPVRSVQCTITVHRNDQPCWSLLTTYLPDLLQRLR